MTPHLLLLVILFLQLPDSRGQFGGFLAKDKSSLDQFFARGFERFSFSNWTHKPLTVGNMKQTFSSLVREMNDNPESTRCLRSIQTIVEAATNQEPWALKIFDAFGKIGNGVSEVGIFWAGSYDLCINAIEKKEIPFRTKYCWTTWANPMTNIITINMSICAPDTCTEKQLFDAINHFTPYFPKNLNFLHQSFTNKLELDSVTCHTDEGYSWSDPYFTLSMFVIFILIGLVSVGTALDYKDHREKEMLSNTDLKKNDHLCCASILNCKTNKEHSSEKDNGEEEGFKKFICCFSMYTNSKKILKIKENSEHLACLNGLRVFSLAYVVFGHSTSFFMVNVDNFTFFLFAMRDFYFQFIMSGVYAVDTFFVLSGLLVIYLYFKDEEKKKMSWTRHYVDRFLRISPVYLFSFFIINMGIYLRMAPTPLDYSKKMQLDMCKEAWPKYVTYFQNFGDTTKDCFGHTWYLGNDMQFFWLTPFFIILMKRSKRMAIIALVLAFLISCMTSLYTVQYVDVDKYYNSGIEELKEYLTANVKLMADVYIKPYCRIGSYTIGMACGWFLYKTKNEFKFSKNMAIVLWTTAVILCVGTAFFPWYGNLTSFNTKLFTALCHNLWSVGLGIIIILCCCGYGGFINTFLSWPGYLPISQLSYSTYLIHSIILATVYASVNRSFHFSYSLLLLVGFGNFQLSLLSAFLLHILVEAPALRLRDKYYKK